MAASTMITLIGIIPGAVILFTALGKYDGKFDDRKVFFSFAIGIVGGAVFGIFHVMLDTWALISIANSVVVFVLVFAFAQIMYLVVLVNRKGLQQKHDAIFAGMSLGVGSGSFVVVYLLHWLTNAVEGSGASLAVTDYAVMFTLSISYALVWGAAGIYAGLFSYHQDRDYIVNGVVVFSLYALVIIPFRTGLLGSLWVWGGSLALGLLMSAVIFFYTYRQIDDHLPVEMEKQMRREARKRSRED